MGKKIITLLFLFLIFSLLIENGFCVDVCDDFNDGTQGNFDNLLGADFWTNDATIKYEGAYGIKINDTSGGLGGGYWCDDETYWDSDVDSISYWIYVDTISAGDFALYLIRANYLEILVDFNSNGDIVCYDNPSTSILDSYEQDTWYLVEIYMNLTAGNYDIYLYDSNKLYIISATYDMRHIYYPSYDDALFYASTSCVGVFYIDYINSPLQPRYYVTCDASSSDKSLYNVTDVGNFTSSWSTDGTIGYAVFSWNYSGSYVNDTVLWFDDVTSFNILKYMGGNSSYNGTVITWKIFCYVEEDRPLNQGVSNEGSFTLQYLTVAPEDDSSIGIGILATLLSVFAIGIYASKRK